MIRKDRDIWVDKHLYDIFGVVCSLLGLEEPQGFDSAVNIYAMQIQNIVMIIRQSSFLFTYVDRKDVDRLCDEFETFFAKLVLMSEDFSGIKVKEFIDKFTKITEDLLDECDIFFDKYVERVEDTLKLT